MTERSIVLFGDSILDNAPYTRPAPDTTAVLSRLLGSSWSVERLAQDGATMADIQFQLSALVSRPDIAVLSVGGNDAVEHIELLNRQQTSSAGLLGDLVGIADDFGRRYEAVARTVAERAARLVLCTIYDVPLEPAPFDRLVRVPLALINDRIIRIGASIGADILELRSVCTERQDFVLQIEPSARGADKIARAIEALVLGTEELRSSRLFCCLTNA